MSHHHPLHPLPPEKRNVFATYLPLDKRETRNTRQGSARRTRHVLGAVLAATLALGTVIGTETVASAEEQANELNTQELVASPETETPKVSETPDDPEATELPGTEEKLSESAGEGVPARVATTATEGAHKSADTSPLDQSLSEPQPTATRSSAQLVESGSMSWGIRTEWRNYIGLGPGTPGPGATGEILVEAGASRSPDNLTTWVNGSGSVDLAAGTGTISYEGRMVFLGHPARYYPHEYPGGSGKHWGMIQTYENPQITLTSPTTATLSFEMTQVSALTQWPSITVPQRIDLVDLTFDAAALAANGSVIAVNPTLTQAGSDLWGNYGAYIPGVAMDDVAFSVNAPLQDERKSTGVALTASQTSLLEGHGIDLTATPEPAIPGTVTFRFGGAHAEQIVETEGGVATYRVTDLPVGEHTLTAEFLPSDVTYRGARSNEIMVSVTSAADPSSVEGSFVWGVKKTFRDYVVGSIATGEITVSHGAEQGSNNGVFTYPQAATGKEWNGTTGNVQYAGQVNFYGHAGAMNVTLANPVIRVVNSSTAELLIPFGEHNTLVAIANIDLGSALKQSLDGDAVRFSGATTTLTKEGAERVFVNDTGTGPAGTFYAAGEQMDNLTFTIGQPSKHEIAEPPKNTPKPSRPQPTPESRPAAPGSGAATAGSLRWGVSSFFVGYTTQKSGSSGCPTAGGHCAGGSIHTSGVGAGWLFPQAAGSSWDATSQTGTVAYSGVVSFNGYGLTMFEIANPRITVHDASSATLATGYSGTYGPSQVALDLSRATKTVGADGAVTWSNVPVAGSLVGLNSNQTSGFDALTFTVGEASAVQFGSTRAGGDTTGYTAADTPPATTGLEVVTEADKIREGGRIQVRASGFDPEDEGVLVVLYQASGGDPIVLDEAASANSTGVIEWSGMLPEEGSGDHVITLQGSIDVGAEIDILEKDTQRRASAGERVAPSLNANDLTAAGFEGVGSGGVAPWEWWASAGGLVAIAACMTLLTLRQRQQLG